MTRSMRTAAYNDMANHMDPAYVKAYRERLAANKEVDNIKREKQTIKQWMLN